MGSIVPLYRINVLPIFARRASRIPKREGSGGNAPTEKILKIRKGNPIFLVPTYKCRVGCASEDRASSALKTEGPDPLTPLDPSLFAMKYE